MKKVLVLPSGEKNMIIDHELTADGSGKGAWG